MLVVIMFSFLFCQCTHHNAEDESAVPEGELVIPEGELIIPEGCFFPDVMDKYSYPIEYGTMEWKKIHPDDWLNASQLPDDVLKSISSLGLIRSFIDTPYPIIHICLYASHMPCVTARGLSFDFNSLKELLTRKDGAQALMVFYAATKLDCVESLKEWDNSWEFSLRLATLEYLFTLTEILEKLSREDKKKVVEILLVNYRQWLQLNDSNPQNGNNSRLLTVMVWLMYDDMLPYFDKEILDMLKENILVKDVIDDIVAFAERFTLK